MAEEQEPMVVGNREREAGGLGQTVEPNGDDLSDLEDEVAVLSAKKNMLERWKAEATKIAASFGTVLEWHRTLTYEAAAEWNTTATDERIIGLLTNVSEDVYGAGNEIGVSGVMDELMRPYVEALLGDVGKERVGGLFHIVLLRLGGDELPVVCSVE